MKEPRIQTTEEVQEAIFRMVCSRITEWQRDKDKETCAKFFKRLMLRAGVTDWDRFAPVVDALIENMQCEIENDWNWDGE